VTNAIGKIKQCRGVIRHRAAIPDGIVGRK
jgi:hypothetical protein